MITVVVSSILNVDPQPLCWPKGSVQHGGQEHTAEGTCAVPNGDLACLLGVGWGQRYNH